MNKEDGVLYKTKAVVIGPMEQDIANGRLSRAHVKYALDRMGIVLWDHYNTPYMGNVAEGEDTHKKLLHLRETEQYDKLAEYRDIRVQDLSMMDRCDFIICIFHQRTFTVGTIEELTTAVRAKRPIFFVWGEGKSKCPFWIFWMIPHKYIYSSVKDVLQTIGRINSGEKEIDSNRWRLLKKSYR